MPPGRRARGRDHGRSSHRPPPAPLPHRQHPGQQLPDESAPGPAAIGVARKPSRSRVVTTTTRSRAAGPGPDSGRSAPYGRPRTDRTHPPTATGTATAPSDKVCSFQLPQVCSFRLPLTPGSDDETVSITGSIPAGAGEPVPDHRRQTDEGVYPRGCGGTLARCSRCLRARGLSPRVRGNQRGLGPVEDAAGSIPAGAGEPTARRRSTVTKRVYPRGCGGTRTTILPSE